MATIHEENIPATSKANTIQEDNIPAESKTDLLFVPEVAKQMRELAAESTVTDFAKAKERTLLLFGCDRSLPICRYDGIPEFLLDSAASHFECFSGTAQPGEFYVFQIGVYNTASSCSAPLALSWQDISFEDHRCFNFGGIDQYGKRFEKEVTVAAGTMQPLWFGVQVPVDASGQNTFSIQLSDGSETIDVIVNLTVEGDVLHDHGDSDPHRLARLRWLDSTLGHDKQFIPSPYRPIEFSGNSINVIGRKTTLSSSGLPSQIFSSFNSTNTDVNATPRELLAAPFQFTIKANGSSLPVTYSAMKILDQTAEEVRFEIEGRTKQINVTISGQANYAGFTAYQLAIQSDEDIEIDDIGLEFEMNKEFASHFIGLDQRGEVCPDSVDWRWDRDMLQDGFWLGAVSGGMRLRFKGDNFRTPLNNAYYNFGKINEPESWANDGKGGISINKGDNGNVRVNAYSGNRTLKSGSTLHYNVDIDVTPLKPIDSKRQWQRRFFHSMVHRFQVDENPLGLSPAEAKAGGATHYNIHHATGPNPIINYPYSDISLGKLKDIVDECHQNQLKVGIYYTTREISVNIPEFWALLSLNGEIIYPGPGAEARPVTNADGPHPWLVENVQAPFIPAWREEVRGDWGGRLDLSVITSPDSRWNNFYMEGMAYLLQETSVDGFYFDDTLLSRHSFHRIRKITSDAGVEGNLDFHSWNPFRDFGGSCTVVCRDFEYYHNLDNLWLGESFFYDDMSADNWLLEVSGLPYGLMSEMLRDGGNPWRGLLFGMTCRYGWQGDPHNIWKLWDEFGILDSQLQGWWQQDCPVRSTNPDVKASAYVRDDAVLICLASWAEETAETSIEIDWSALAFGQANVESSLPEIDDLQNQAACSASQTFSIEPLSGAVILLRKS